MQFVQMPFLYTFFTFGSSSLSEYLTKLRLGSEEPKLMGDSKCKGREIYFKTLYRTQLKKVRMIRQPLSPSFCLSSFPVSLESLFPNLTLSLFHICSIFLIADYYSASLKGFSFLFPHTWFWAAMLLILATTLHDFASSMPTHSDSVFVSLRI